MESTLPTFPISHSSDCLFRLQSAPFRPCFLFFFPCFCFCLRLNMNHSEFLSLIYSFSPLSLPFSLCFAVISWSPHPYFFVSIQTSLVRPVHIRLHPQLPIIRFQIGSNWFPGESAARATLLPPKAYKVLCLYIIQGDHNRPRTYSVLLYSCLISLQFLCLEVRRSTIRSTPCQQWRLLRPRPRCNPSIPIRQRRPWPHIRRIPRRPWMSS